MTTERNYERDHEKAAELDLEARTVRALEEEMIVCEHIGAARGEDGVFLVVSESGSEYTVDVHAGSCSCPDHEYNDNHCKHLRRTILETGMRPVRAIYLDALDVSSQFDGEHVDGEPDVVPPQTGIDAGADVAHAVATDGGAERPADCSCVAPSDREDGRELPCFPCYNAGFRSPNPEVATDE